MLSKEEISQLLPDRTWESIRKRMEYLGLERQKKWEYWSDNELFLLKNATSLEDAIKKLPKRSISKIKTMANKMRLAFDRTPWKKEDAEYLIANYNKLNPNEIADNLNRSVIAIYQKANKLNLISYRNCCVELTFQLVELILNEKKTTEGIYEEFPYIHSRVMDDLSILKMYEEGHSSTYISNELNYSVNTIITKLKKYGIEIKGSGFYNSANREDWKKYGKLLRRLRCTSEYRNWRKEVLERDAYTCQCCQKSKNIDLEAHHIHNFSSNEELRFSIDNGIILCRECHIEFHTIYGYRNNNQLQLDEFISNTLEVALLN